MIADTPAWQQGDLAMTVSRNHVTYMTFLDFNVNVGEAEDHGPNLESLMTMGSQRTIEARGYLAAIQRFPHSELAIRRLINQSETFRDICEELAEAETVLSKYATATDVDHGARKEEWQALVDRLVAEVAASLRRAKLPDQRNGTREEE